MKSSLSLVEKFFGTWDRRFNSLTLILGFLNSLVAFYAVAHPDDVPSYIAFRDVAITLSLIAIILFLMVRYFRKDSILQKTKRQLSEQERSMHAVLSAQLKYSNNIVRLSTQELFDQHKAVFLKGVDIPINQEEYEVFKNICSFVTDWVRDSTKDYLKSKNIDIGEDISVSVKLILTPKDILNLYPQHLARNRDVLQREQNINAERLWVITAFRDPKTYRELTRTGGREVLGTLYSLEGNTAFQEIYNGQGRHDRFQCNDLMDLHSHNHYDNENPGWQKDYNSTLVVPLVLEHSSRDKRRYLGFLAVDSKNPEHNQLYEREECYWILNHAAQVLSNYFLAQILYHDIII